MKLPIYITLFVLLATTTLAASWGDVDFRILTSDDELVLPIVIEFENTRGTDLEAVLVIETLSPEANFGPSEYEDTITISKNPELLYINFPITEREINYDVWVNVWVNDELAEQMYNSLLRLRPEMLEGKNELTPTPGEQLQEENKGSPLAKIRTKYPNFDQLDENEKMRIIHTEKAAEYGLTEEEYLERIGSDADTIDELVNRDDSAQIKELNKQHQEDFNQGSAKANTVGIIMAIILLIVVGGIGYFFIGRRR
jgi:hypothetical protein